MVGRDWGINLGLFLHCTLKLPKRTILDIRLGSACTFDGVLHKRKVLWENPFNSKDVLYVPYTVPTPSSFKDDFNEYASQNDLYQTNAGQVALQRLSSLIPYVITRDHEFQPPLHTFTGDGEAYEILLQGDGARRGTRAFTQWVFKNAYRDSASPHLLFLFALALKLKDNRSGAALTFGAETAVLNSLQGGVVTVPDPYAEGMFLEVKTKLSMTLDLCAERDFFGIINGGCMCQGHDGLHRLPKNRRAQFKSWALADEWCSGCKEPTLLEQHTLAHRAYDGAELPEPCTKCEFGHGTHEQRVAEYALDLSTEVRMVTEAAETQEAKTKLDTQMLGHAHSHGNVRWGWRGTPPIMVPKANTYLEKLHSWHLNAAKQHLKHAHMKNMPDAIRETVHTLFRQWGVPIDSRKPGKRTEDKWPGGGIVQHFMAGGNNKAPGFAVSMAELTFIMAEHWAKGRREREELLAAAEEEEEEEGSAAAVAKVARVSVFAKPGTKKHAAGAAKAPVKKSTVKAATAVKNDPIEMIKTEVEVTLGDTVLIAAIKDKYGPYVGQRIVTTLLADDAFLTAWRTGMRSLPGDPSTKEVEAFALEHFLNVGDWIELLGHLSDHTHKSWVPHRLLAKGSRQLIATKGKDWIKSTSALEANQAEVGRTLDRVTCRRTGIDEGEGERTFRAKKSKEGNDVLQSYSVSKGMASSCAEHYIASQNYQRDTENAVRKRATDRLLLEPQGRSTAPRAGDKLRRLASSPSATAMGEFIKLMRGERTVGLYEVAGSPLARGT
jgi:hypothetical protein